MTSRPDNKTKKHIISTEESSLEGFSLTCSKVLPQKNLVHFFCAMNWIYTIKLIIRVGKTNRC